MKRLVICAVLAALFGTSLIARSSEAGATAAVHPRLLLTSAEVPSLRARVSAGVPAQAWAKLKEKADAYTDPTSASYVDPALVQQPYFDGIAGQKQMATYLTELGFAYVVSNDPRYGDHAARLMNELATYGFPAWNKNELGRGDLGRGYGLAFDWVYDRVVALGFRTHIVTRLVAQLPGLDLTGTVPRNGVFESTKLFSCLDRDWHQDPLRHNWMGVCGGGQGLLLLAIEGEVGVPDLTPWLGVARLRVGNHFSIYGANGDSPEGILYAGYGLQNALPFAVADADLHGTALVTANVRNVPRWLAAEQLPGQGMRFVPRNDSSTTLPGWHEVLPFFFRLGDAGSTGWLWDRTTGPLGDDLFNRPGPYVAQPLVGDVLCTDPVQDPTRILFCWISPEPFTILYHQDPPAVLRTAPAALSRLYDDYGLVTMRSGNSGTSAEIVATYEAKHHQPTAAHKQEDIGQFNLYGYGAGFAVDSGYGHNYSCAAVSWDGCTPTDPTTYNGRGQGHNVPSVDGITRQPAHGGSATTNTISAYLDAPGMTVVRSNTSTGFFGYTGIRRVAFGRAVGEPVMLATSDVVTRDASLHDYRWQVHTDGANALTVAGDRFVAVAPNGAAMAGAVSESSGATRVLVAEPWHQPAIVDSTKGHNVVLSIDPQKYASFDHLAVLALTPSGAPATVERLACTGCNLVSVRWEGGEALWTSRRSGATSATRLTSDGRFAKVSLGRGETMLLDGTSLVVDGRTYATVTGGLSGSLSVSGDRVTVLGGTGTTYRVYVPQTISSVSLNGAAASFTRDGFDIVFTA